jgi:CubicO group peptidase (beta-lactamase class C family)
VLVIGGRGGIRYQRGYGHLTWRAQSPVPSPDSTLWDLASLTKVVGTLPAVARLVDEGRVDLAAPVGRYLPRFGGGTKDRVTVRMLLDHSSGLPSYVEFFRLTRTRDSAIALLYRTPLRRAPGSGTEYSDLNFLLLGLLIEAVTGEPLERFVERVILVPARLSRTRYGVSDALQSRTAPTGQYRGRPVCCAVNDQNAVRMGGAAGHAGLFSTGADMARYLRLWLNLGVLDGVHLLGAATVRTFLTPASPEATRLLGWERPPHRLGADNRAESRPATTRGRPHDSAYGGLLSDQAFGHTGWTGTLLWADPGHDLFLVLLTNRSYGARVGNSIRALRGIRGALADAVVREAGAMSQHGFGE